MSPGLDVRPCLEGGMLRATATFQDPVVSLREPDGDALRLVLEEGGVVVELEFPDLGSVARFQRRLAALLPSPRHRRNR